MFLSGGQGQGVPACMLGVAEEFIYLTEGGETASFRGADEAKLLAIVFVKK